MKPRLARSLVLGLGCALALPVRTPAAPTPARDGVDSTPITPGELKAALERAAEPGEERYAPGSRFVLAPGRYFLEPRPYLDERCGNCEDPDVRVKASVGWIVSGDGIRIEAAPGAPAEEVIIHTRAGYGILFQDCQDCALRGVTVRDGIRDEDPNATDAAVVVSRSSVAIEDCLLTENLGDSILVATNVVGVMGIAGREGAAMTIRRNRIVRNSWDGIALYRGASAEIVDNVVDGVDKARGAEVGGGRGVGIGLTWDAKAHVEGNLVTRTWKGIGIFVDAEATVVHNVVEEVLTWGIAYWDAGRGRPVGRIESNVVFDAGACGISIARETAATGAPGHCRGNVVVRTGQNPRYDDPELYCEQVPIAVFARPEGFTIADNVLFDNRCAKGMAEGEELDRASFVRASAPLVETLRSRPALLGARCFREMGSPGQRTRAP